MHASLVNSGDDVDAMLRMVTGDVNLGSLGRGWRTSHFSESF
jgi:hypothetical protein